MKVEVICPEANVGDVLGDLNARRGQIEDVGFRGEQRVITAKVPLRRMFGYSTDLRSATQGRANYSMQFETLRRLGVGDQASSSINGPGCS